MLGTMASALALDAVLSTAAAGDAVVDFTPPSAGGCFSHSSNRNRSTRRITGGHELKERCEANGSSGFRHDRGHRALHKRSYRVRIWNEVRSRLIYPAVMKLLQPYTVGVRYSTSSVTWFTMQLFRNRGAMTGLRSRSSPVVILLSSAL
ncbi:hypothetical protein F2P81_002229 [Scophthalmus maximus]|uniref:Secreted protein n=1 Tax=Scophthalmus maximus TaxID=52904 RepID=A0A6A4TQ52_SCOMX|nr:hypothetical protein F2P81_002229 [Scophthalmus maximus]